MTLIPHENRDVHGLDGPAFPRYKVGPVCCVPGCSRFADHAHHVWRRSFLGGDYAWVELWDHTILGNLSGLCWQHHDEVTQGKVWMRYDEKRKRVVWDDNNTKYPADIFPALPVHGEPATQGKPDRVLGPGAAEVCPGCKRTLPREKPEGEKNEEARRRKTWTVTVPADSAEDGALVLDTMIEACRELFSHPEDKNVRYFTLVQALALVVQHGHVLVSETT